MNTRKLRLLSAALATALAVAACGGGGGGGGYEDPSPPPPTPPEPKAESFTEWFKTGVFAKPAEEMPEIMDDLVWDFDGNDDPEAFADLIPPEPTA